MRIERIGPGRWPVRIAIPGRVERAAAGFSRVCVTGTWSGLTEGRRAPMPLWFIRLVAMEWRCDAVSARRIEPMRLCRRTPVRFATGRRQNKECARRECSRRAPTSVR